MKPPAAGFSFRGPVAGTTARKTQGRLNAGKGRGGHYKKEYRMNEQMLADDGKATYTCGPTGCGYDGDTYCQNCGYSRDENAEGVTA